MMMKSYSIQLPLSGAISGITIHPSKYIMNQPLKEYGVTRIVVMRLSPVVLHNVA